MTAPKSPMSQENFAATTRRDGTGRGDAMGPDDATGRHEKSTDADFSTDTGALAYANAMLDKLVAAMRYKLEKHIIGWPGDDRELDTHEALRHLLRDFNFGHAAYVEADYRNPALTKMGATTRIQFQLPSPDCVYHSCILHGDHRYRLTGNRGSASIFQLTIYAGHACDLIGWKTHSMINNIDFPVDLGPDKAIDVVLSRTRPDDLGEALWLELPEGPCELHSRQYYGDWETQNAADLILSHQDQTFPAALLDRKTAQTRFTRLVDLLRVHSDFYKAGVQAHLRADPNEIGELVIPGAFEGTNYYPGHFRCQAHQAVIIEVEDPGSLYWNTALFQMQYEPGDWWARLSSYNSSQVHTNSDGKVRFVASWKDPGVPNWLDASGRVLHLIAFRFFRAARTPMKPKLTTVPLQDVRQHLPADTPMVDARKRHEQMVRRLMSVYRRRCADF